MKSIKSLRNVFIPVIVFSVLCASCKQKPAPEQQTIQRDLWGQADGKKVELVTMTNGNSMVVKITNFGGILTYVAVPDRNDSLGNVVLGFDNLEQYKQEHPYFGAIVGRYGNRIGNAKFTLNDTVYNLAANNGPNTLHGGIKSFGHHVFNIDTVYQIGDSSVLKISRTSPHMEEGFPGNLYVSITYTLTPENEIVIEYEAETDRETVLNLTNHSYFNLTGGKESILNHELVLFADSITPTDEQLIPTGALTPVAGTAFDFTTSHAIGERIDQVPGGYDINYKLRNTTGEYVKAAEVYEPTTGRLLEAFTTEPGVQFYTGNFLNGQLKGHDDIVYNKHFGFCLEMQHFPDSPNQPQFPTTVLKPGEKYTQKTVYKFSIR